MNIFSVGDSHCDYCFSGIPGLKVRWLGPRTMHRVGRDGTKFLDMRKLGIGGGDIAIWSFGEIDVRTHIGRLRDSGQQDVDVMIDALTCRYVTVAAINRELVPGLEIVISSLVPPSDKITREDETLPFYGTIQDRVTLTQKVNRSLSRHCGFLQFPVIDVYTPFAGADGALPPESRADLLHLDRRFVSTTQSNLERLLGRSFAA